MAKASSNKLRQMRSELHELCSDLLDRAIVDHKDDIGSRYVLKTGRPVGMRVSDLNLSVDCPHYLHYATLQYMEALGLPLCVGVMREALYHVCEKMNMHCAPFLGHCSVDVIIDAYEAGRRRRGLKQFMKSILRSL